ncbi:hypothetical protein ACWGA9_03345 [Streptomyces sp. NPDC054950]
MAIEGRAHVGVGGQGRGTAEDVGRDGVDTEGDAVDPPDRAEVHLEPLGIGDGRQQLNVKSAGFTETGTAHLRR